MSLPASVDAWVRLLTLLPILACSVVGLALMAAKWTQLRRTGPGLAHVRALIREKEFTRALTVASVDASPAARLVEHALMAADQPRERLTAHVERAGRALAAQLRHGLGGLALIATLGPLLGLLGTVVGIVVVFQRLEDTAGMASPDQLAGGIGTALYTTVAGLVVGICALVSHRYLSARADRTITQLEAEGEELLELICGEPT